MTPLLLLSLPVFLLPFGYVVWLFVLYRTPPVTGTAVAPEYEPPKGVGPAEAAYLLDGVLKPRAFAAMLVDLHLRGAIVIETDAAGRVGGFVGVAPRDGLEPYERRCLAALFGDGTVASMAEATSRLADAGWLLQNAVRASLADKGLLGGNLFLERIVMLAAAVSAMMIGVSAVAAVGFLGGIGIGAALVLLTQFIYVAATWRPRLTAEGRAAVAHCMGYRTYLAQVAAGEIAMKERAGDAPDAETPFAIVFGIAPAWATKLQSVTDELLKINV